MSADAHGARTACAALTLCGAHAAHLHELERWRSGWSWWSQRRALPDGVVSPQLSAKLRQPALEDRARAMLRRTGELGARFVSEPDDQRLARLAQRPLGLFVAGQCPVPEAPRVAIVGARHASAYGLETARRFARTLAGQGIWILSGLARGIDAAAHRGALEAPGGRTLAVLGSGIDVIYPEEHDGLAREISREGGVVTEHPPGTTPRPHHFPRRNRILVGLADVVLVVESRIKSGTLTSVRWAADLGIEVLVVPGRIDSPVSEGPLTLLREGATPVLREEHVLEALGFEGAQARGPGATVEELPAEDGLEGRLLAMLAAGPLGLDELVTLTVEPPGLLLGALLGLEAKGLLVREADQRFRRTHQSGGLTSSQPKAK